MKTMQGPLQELIMFLDEQQSVLSLPKHSVSEWAEKALNATSVPNKPGVIDGRLFLIVILLDQFSQVHASVSDPQQWRALCSDLIDTLDTELQDKEGVNYRDWLTEPGKLLHSRFQKPLEMIFDSPNVSDGPATQDSLSRRALAEYLSKRLRFIYNRDIAPGKVKTSDKSGRQLDKDQSGKDRNQRKGFYGSFFMHIDGAWGSGKSTLLGFMQSILENPGKQGINQKALEPWIIVNFNAWENQRLDPPWWFLLKTVYTKALKRLWKLNKSRAVRLMVSEWAWRLNTGSNYLIATILTLILLLLALKMGINDQVTFSKLPIVELVAFIGFLWSLSKFLRTGLVPGSAKAAKTFMEENSKDPMHILSRHFSAQLNLIGYPVAIFIDDLDRCNEVYGVKLLEGLQTVFRNAPIVYVVAADRKWLISMYEQHYKNFIGAMKQPAKSFGMIFLDKTFQWITQLPDISSLQKKMFWYSLLGISISGVKAGTNQEIQEVENKVNEAQNDTERIKILEASDLNSINLQNAREQIVRSISIGEEEKSMENTLIHFIDLIEPNPREMIRLINDISTSLAINFLYNLEIDQNQMILWTILKQHYPLIAEFFWYNPEQLEVLLKDRTSQNPISDDPDFDELLKSNEVHRILNFEINGIMYHVDAGFIKKLRFQNTESSSNQAITK